MKIVGLAFAPGLKIAAMALGKKITFISVSIVLGFLPVIIAAFFFLNRSINEQNRVIENFSSQRILAEHLREMFEYQAASIPRFLLSGDAKILVGFDGDEKAFEVEADRLSSFDNDESVKNLMVHVKRVASSLHKLALPGIDMRSEGGSPQNVDRWFREHAGPMTDQLVNDLNKVVNLETENLNRAREEARQTLHWMMICLGVLAVLAFGMAFFMLRAILQTLQQKELVDQAQAVLLDNQKRMAQARKEAVEVVAHDLRNPISAIQMSLDLVSQSISNDNKECLEIAMRSASTMRNLVEDLLDHAKIESGKLVLEPKVCRIDSLLKDLFTRFSLLAADRGILFEANIQLRNLISRCDSARIEQAISNILGNALKFTPKGGTVTLGASATDRDFLISVKDGGQGISEEQLPHIFDRFWQAQGTAKQGTGLGLAIVKAVVDAHHGKIWVKSSPGNGCEFFMSLPITGQ